MFVRARLLCFVPLAALLACSSSSPTYTVGGGAQTGDYVLTVAPGTANASMFNGALTVAGTNVSGVFAYDNPGSLCVSPSQTISVSGSVVNGTLKLTSASFSGSVATLSFPVPLTTNTSAQQTSTGTAVIAGGPCALSSTPLVAQLIPSFSGVWNGNFDTTAASFGITQSGPSGGSFPISATGSFCGSTNVTLAGVLTGTTLQMSSTTGTISISANAGTTANTLNVTETCPTGSASGTFTR